MDEPTIESLQTALAERDKQIEELTGKLQAVTGQVKSLTDAATKAKADAEAASKAKKSTEERLAELSGRFDGLTRSLQQEKTNAALADAVSGHQLVDADLARTAFTAGTKIEISEDGSILAGGKPVKEAFAEFVKAKPYLVKAPATGGGAGGGTTPTGGPAGAKRFTRAQLAAMSPEEFRKNEAAIDAAMAAGQIGE